MKIVESDNKKYITEKQNEKILTTLALTSTYRTNFHGGGNNDDPSDNDGYGFNDGGFGNKNMDIF